MSEAFVNQVTLDCLLNKQQYENYVKKKTSKGIDKKEKNFYKKRILNLTKEFLSTEKNENMLPEVKYAFDNYVKACIHSFKILDNNDIIQSEYHEINKIESLNEEKKKEKEKEMEENETVIDEEESKKIQEETDSIFARSTVKIINPSLDNFIIKSSQIKEEIILPKQKEINLNEESLKNKGIGKKKNISNNYEDKTKNKK